MWDLMDRVSVPSGFFSAYMIMVAISILGSFALIFWLLRTKKTPLPLGDLPDMPPIPPDVPEKLYVPKPKDVVKPTVKENIVRPAGKTFDIMKEPAPKSVLKDLEDTSMYDKPRTEVLKPVVTPPEPKSVPPPIYRPIPEINVPKYTPEQLDNIPELPKKVVEEVQEDYDLRYY